ncbi:UDP-glucuronosyltransferase 2A2-like [Ptychodera flava]|uniref:UDP-glucuronosyltransferase 2A2-like n=1 Tax=Ptychodera flava TaxID=63121 RepID=UPI00396A8999
MDMDMDSLDKSRSGFKRHILFQVVLLSLFAVGEVSCSNILVIPGLSSGSSYPYLSSIGEHLVKAGHRVTLLVGHQNDIHKTPHHRELFKFEEYNTVLQSSLVENRENLAKIIRGEFRATDVTVLTDALLSDCEVILEDQELFTRLSDARFDIVVLNNLMTCNVLIAQKLSLPFVMVSTNRPIPQFDAYYLAMPTPLSYVPAFLTGLPDKMNFAQRLKNALFYSATVALFKYFMLKPYEDLKQLHGIQPDIGIEESLGMAEITLFGVDWTLEFPRPVMPNIVFLGGLLAKESSPLTASASMMSRHGKAEIIMEALARLPQKVVIRYEGEPPRSLGNNTKLTEWMPQNDLLGHPKTKAFVGHGGMNGIYQAIFHGIPTVGIPLFTDHYDNFARLVKKGMAVELNIGTLTSEELYQAIMNVIKEPGYRESAMHLSRIHRDKLVPPGDTAVYWIEHVIKHGGEHLRAEVHNLNFIQYFLLDVIAFLVLTVTVLVLLLRKMLSVLCRACCKRESRKEKPE